jgi:hypothetical protein
MATRTTGRHWLVAGTTACILFVCIGAAFAQSVSSGAIQGTVKDDSNAVLPGVTMTLTSPSLQVPQIVQVSDASGGYKFVDLPAGTYALKAELPGFATIVRDGLRLTVGFIASVDFVLKVGAMQETVTVSGQSPVVDVTSTSASVAFTKETLEAVPRGRDLQNIIAMAPGVTPETPDVGGSTMANRQDISSYGVAAQPKLQVEGMNIAMGADMNTPIYFNDNTLEEVQIKTSGNDAEVSTPGISMVAILKSGGNTFHGSFAAASESPSLQSSNLNASLKAQGLSNTQPLESFYDVAGDLGGRIIRDKLWFYGAASRQAKKQGLVGFVADAGPDGAYLTGDEPIAYFGTSLTQYSAKLSYQISKNNRLVYAWQRGTKAQPQNGAGRFVPLEATRDYKNPTAIQKAELQSAINPRVLLNLIGGFAGYITDYDAARSYARADAPPRRDLDTGLRTGSHPLHQNKTRDRYQTEDSVTFFPVRSFMGHHELKTGIMIYLDRSSDGYKDNLACNCVLITDTINGVPETPTQIQIYNTPVTPADHEDTYAWYLKDSWRPTGSLTFNLGLRWERQHSYLPAQSYDGARDFPEVFPAGAFSKIDVQTFNRVVPRLGMAWDLGHQTVIKATFGEYNYILGDTYADVFNRNATANATFRWHDVNGDRLWQRGESNLSLAGGNPDFVSITSASNRVLNPDLKQPRTWETTASFERELAPSLAFRSMYVYRRLEDYLSNINTLRPYDAFSIPITRRDPGPDGVLGTGDDAGSVTLFDYDRAFSGAAFVNSKTVNNTNSDTFHSIEFTLTKRSSSRWMAQASYFVVKNRDWVVGVFQSPNDEFFPVDETWSWAGNATASYRIPGDVMVSAFLQSRSGIKGQRTYQFREADPDGGTRISQSKNITLRLERAGARQLDAMNILNLRASKTFSVGGARRIGVDFDLFNALNAATPLSASFASGPTFGYVTDVVAARIARVGARFLF